MGSLIFQPLGFALAGPISVGLGIGPTLLLASAVFASSSVVVLVVPSVRNLRRVEPPLAPALGNAASRP